MTSVTIDAALLDRPLDGLNIQGSTLRREISETPVLLVFLRHFGCIFCRELVKDLKAISSQTDDYPPLLFFYQGTPEEGAVFFKRVWPEARAVSDIPKTYYNAFGIERGGLREMFGPVVWACGVRATLKGSFIGWKTGDPWTMPGMFAVQGDYVLWQHDFHHAGDHPDLATIPALIRSAAQP
ncbi:MAG: SelL-related redox protein [Chloroflexota bacterium]